MKLSDKLIRNLQNKLKVGNRRGVQLNSIPGRSRYKFDLNNLSALDKELPNQFIEALTSKQPLKFRISFKEHINDIEKLKPETQVKLYNLAKFLDNIINQTDSIESEKGINTFGFGFPQIARRDHSDNKLTVAPLLIWQLKIKRTKELNTWEIRRVEDDAIYINEVLINHLNNDSNISIEPLSNDYLDDGLIDKKELIETCYRVLDSINSGIEDIEKDRIEELISNIVSIKDKKYFEKLTEGSSNSYIYPGALFSIFEIQKQNIIKDFEKIIEEGDLTLNLDDLKNNTFQSLSSVDTDPSQQSILNSLDKKTNILIQGPPGTGKSQSLTAILINALENHKKTIVVCEKRTALEVLENALIEKGLSNHIVLIKDIVKDRRTAVDSVRSRIDGSSYKRYEYLFSKDSLLKEIKKSENCIKKINSSHQKLGKIIIHDKNYSETVGLYLKEVKICNGNYDLDIDNKFEYESNEFENILFIINRNENLFKEYKIYRNYSFINKIKFKYDNSFELEAKFLNDFNSYKQYIYGEDSLIKKLTKIENIFDLEKTDKLFFKINALFDKSKKEIITKQKQLFKELNILKDLINKQGWILIKKNTSEGILNEIDNFILKYDNYIGNENDIFTIEYNWFNSYLTLKESDKKIIDSLENYDDWKNVFAAYYYSSILKKSSDNDLPRSDSYHKELLKNINGIKKEQINYINEYWHSKQIDATRDFYHKNNKGLSVENLYNKRSGKNHKRLSLRNIIKYDLNLFTSFFPIILTTPDVCSNLFHGNNKYFDIVLFDEASQLKLEDTLPAMLKAKQIIIAGDEHQMPPSNYFSKVFDGLIDDEDQFEDDQQIHIDRDEILLDCESLLDFGTELNFEKQYLDFHYRSQHPSLIEFSNSSFYHNRLKPLPMKKDYIAIEYHQVNGTYSDHCNNEEARQILNFIEHKLLRNEDGEYPTIGIASFNIAQRNLIKRLIIERQCDSSYYEFNTKMDEIENNGFFIKNLENIQGDERDIIILSTTYGINEDGQFNQRFGPINHKKGYKLLNVIVTRAKQKVIVFTSVPEHIFLGYNDHLVTEGSNNRKGIFYAYLAYAKSISEKNKSAEEQILNNLKDNSPSSTKLDYLNSVLESPFEEEVYNALIENVEKEKIIPQLKFAGFRIDLVYDTGINGAKKIAIECDGAAYHSSKEAYLYDLHRQKILEQNGFVFHRIWSTNWFRNHKRETGRLVKFINEIETISKQTTLKYD
jgi:superfamily I DNA and/or RNA helicase/very-short-patch-repair endonuclease